MRKNLVIFLLQVLIFGSQIFHFLIQVQDLVFLVLFDSIISLMLIFHIQHLLPEGFVLMLQGLDFQVLEFEHREDALVI